MFSFLFGIFFLLGPQPLRWLKMEAPPPPLPGLWGRGSLLHLSASDSGCFLTVGFVVFFCLFFCRSSVSSPTQTFTERVLSSSRAWVYWVLCIDYSRVGNTAKKCSQNKLRLSVFLAILRYCEVLLIEFCWDVIFEIKQIVLCRSDYAPYSTKTKVTERTESSPKEWVTAWFARHGTKKLQQKPNLCTNKITVALCSAEDQLFDTLVSSPTKQDYSPTDRWFPQWLNIVFYLVEALVGESQVIITPCLFFTAELSQLLRLWLCEAPLTSSKFVLLLHCKYM